jgi:predicted cupin superfamily sugar epimerase
VRTPEPLTVDGLVSSLGLLPHPEGGFYRETYRSPEILAAAALPARFRADRAMSTAIYFLVQRGAFSALHRIHSDEVWHFYRGGALEIVCLDRDGQRRDLRLGPDLDRGDVAQAMVPAGTWFGSRVVGDGDFALVGCTVAPGFDFADFELAGRADLTSRFPAHAAVIAGLTRA